MQGSPLLGAPLFSANDPDTPLIGSNRLSSHPREAAENVASAGGVDPHALSSRVCTWAQQVAESSSAQHGGSRQAGSPRRLHRPNSTAAAAAQDESRATTANNSMAYSSSFRWYVKRSRRQTGDDPNANHNNSLPAGAVAESHPHPQCRQQLLQPQPQHSSFCTPFDDSAFHSTSRGDSTYVSSSNTTREDHTETSSSHTTGSGSKDSDSDSNGSGSGGSSYSSDSFDSDASNSNSSSNDDTTNSSSGGDSEVSVPVKNDKDNGVRSPSVSSSEPFSVEEGLKPPKEKLDDLIQQLCRKKKGERSGKTSNGEQQCQQREHKCAAALELFNTYQALLGPLFFRSGSPTFVQLLLYSYLPVEDLLTLSEVNSLFYAMVNEECVWKHRCLSYPFIPVEAEKKASFVFRGSWKHTVVLHHFGKSSYGPVGNDQGDFASSASSSPATLESTPLALAREFASPNVSWRNHNIVEARILRTLYNDGVISESALRTAQPPRQKNMSALLTAADADATDSLLQRIDAVFFDHYFLLDPAEEKKRATLETEAAGHVKCEDASLDVYYSLHAQWNKRVLGVCYLPPPVTLYLEQHYLSLSHGCINYFTNSGHFIRPCDHSLRFVATFLFPGVERDVYFKNRYCRNNEYVNYCGLFGRNTVESIPPVVPDARTAEAESPSPSTRGRPAAADSYPDVGGSWVARSGAESEQRQQQQQHEPLPQGGFFQSTNDAEDALTVAGSPLLPRTPALETPAAVLDGRSFAHGSHLDMEQAALVFYATWNAKMEKLRELILAGLGSEEGGAAGPSKKARHHDPAELDGAVAASLSPRGAAPADAAIFRGHLFTDPNSSLGPVSLGPIPDEMRGVPGHVDRRWRLSPREFRDYYERYNIPVVITGCLDAADAAPVGHDAAATSTGSSADTSGGAGASVLARWPARTRWMHTAIISSRGSFYVKGNGRSSNKRRYRLPLRDYYGYAHSVHGEKPMYVFDKKILHDARPFHPSPPPPPTRDDASRWTPLTDDYTVLPYFSHDYFNLLTHAQRPDHQWILIGANGSGTPFHTDPHATSAWNAVMDGVKRFTFYPPTESARNVGSAAATHGGHDIRNHPSAPPRRPSRRHRAWFPPGVDGRYVYTEYYASQPYMYWYRYLFPSVAERAVAAAAAAAAARTAVMTDAASPQSDGGGDAGPLSPSSAPLPLPQQQQQRQVASSVTAAATAAASNSRGAGGDSGGGASGGRGDSRDYTDMQEALVFPGDIVFVPSGWWHQVINYGLTAAVTENYCNDATFPRVAAELAEETHRRREKKRRSLQRRRQRRGRRQQPNQGPDATEAIKVEVSRVYRDFERALRAGGCPNLADQLVSAWQ